jgi:hypothetical protein
MKRSDTMWRNIIRKGITDKEMADMEKYLEPEREDFETEDEFLTAWNAWASGENRGREYMGGPLNAKDSMSREIIQSKLNLKEWEEKLKENKRAAIAILQELETKRGEINTLKRRVKEEE